MKLRPPAIALAYCCALFAAARASAAELAILTPETWQEFAPAGKEVDAIYGDIVLRNARLTAVVAQPLPTRNANMTVKNVGGGLIDFTTRTDGNDQLGAFFPLGKDTNWRSVHTKPEFPNPQVRVEAKSVSVTFGAVLKENEVSAETTYTLVDDADFLLVETRLINTSDSLKKVLAKDETRADGPGYLKGTTGRLTWFYERWWNAAYGIVDAEHTTQYPAGVKAVADLAVKTDANEYAVPVQGSVTLSRRLYVAPDLRSLQDVAAAFPASTKLRTFDVRQAAGNSESTPLSEAYVAIRNGQKVVTAGKTGEKGRFTFPENAQQTLSAVVSSPAHQEIVAEVRPETHDDYVVLAQPGSIVATITNADGGPTPCKVQFRGKDETKDPYFFDKTGEHAVGNLYYSHDGKFELAIPPGKYDCTVSYGPEYDTVEQELTVEPGSKAVLNAKLVRTVQTPGFLSADFHSHSSPSGDNVSSQFGRVLNLLCEHIEYAPCTEHNRLSTYSPHLKRLGVEHLLGTCVGMELTSRPLPTSHFNAFPLKLHEHRQDGGGPAADPDPELQVAHLAMWDDRSAKLIQQNHPDIGWLFYDKNGDGKPDSGFFTNSLPHIDVVEVHPPHEIFLKPLVGSGDKQQNNTIFNWLQLLNQGHRIPGVVNTDAHYNLHGSGFLRIYFESPTDDPAKVTTDDVVHAAEHGHIVMTNGPYLEVRSKTNDGKQEAMDGPGGDLVAADGKVSLKIRVQCANWLDVDRVQVFVNGLPDPKLNFTRKENPDAFQNGALKFERQLELALKEDAHLIVATIGDEHRLGHVMGPEHAKDKPCAVSNPIYIDLDGKGFTPNKDTLGAPLPTKAKGSK
ncbi:MAG: CehA/McbA family metallohydrolase [Pirellulales bacterium]